MAGIVQERQHTPVADECLRPLLHCPLIAHQLDERASFHLGIQLLSIQRSKRSTLDAKARTRVAGSMTQSRTCIGYDGEQYGMLTHSSDEERRGASLVQVDGCDIEPLP